MSKLVHLDDNAYESYQKLVNEGPLPPASAPPSFLNGYHKEDPNWEPVKKVPHARVSKDAHEDLFSSGEPGVSRDERKSLERSRKQKMQQSSVTLSFGTTNDYSRSSTMPDHTSHTWLENVKQQNRERYENNMQDLSNLRNPDRFDRQKMAAEQIRSSASRNKHQNLIKSSVSFGEDDVSRYETVATEGMKFKEADPNVHKWRAEAKKKKMLQSTSKGMKLGEPNRGNMYQTDSEYNLQRTIKKKGYTQYNSKSDQKPSHLRDSVGGLLKGEGVDVPHRGRKTLTPKHAIDSVGSILNQDEDYS
ncbi:hypothetical protein TrLO_g11906 [Triparma laevis f. longispina]|uniref:Uncharacterized protein n=1 Tax=Triparma laevis f. longispina TaxID=1714387 RepID=A0A9W7A9Q0_9STRA|nr:hypothetical protein TrLO_g11906 [Triparma laevis f. longispina]